jgi:hypothetical protein
MKIGHVLGHARGAVGGALIGTQLDRIPGDEAGGDPQPAQQLHHQPGEVAAGAVAAGQGLVGREHPGSRRTSYLSDRCTSWLMSTSTSMLRRPGRAMASRTRARNALKWAPPPVVTR